MKEALLPPKQGVQLGKQLQEFVEGFSQHLRRRQRRYWCCKYLEGLLMPGERKSIQPISQRVADGNVQALHQFVCNSPWSAHQLSLGLSNWLIKQASQSQPGLLILDDTGLPKKGNHSVGVARQYCGALGKVANCQSIVSWHWAGSKLHLPLIGQVYLPKNWTQDQKRLDKARVPLQQRNFRTKWQIALDLFDQFCTQVPYKGMIFDAGYAELRPFLRELDKRKLAYLGQVPSHHCFWPAAINIQDLRAGPKGRKRQYH